MAKGKDQIEPFPSQTEVCDESFFGRALACVFSFDDSGCHWAAAELRRRRMGTTLVFGATGGCGSHALAQLLEGMAD